MHHDATTASIEIDKCFKMKDGSIGDPDVCLGSKLKPVTLDNGVECWAMSPSKYIQEAVRNAENYLGANFGGRTLSKRASAPWPADYSAETDTTTELNVDLANCCQSQIGALNWIVEPGCVDTIAEVSILASQMALPREGHLDAVFHVFACLKKKHNSRLIFDPTYPEIDMSKFHDGRLETFLWECEGSNSIECTKSTWKGS